MSTPNLIESPEDALAFIGGGKSTVTLKSLASGAHYTYKIGKAKDKDDLFFVGLLTGPDNGADYQYIGYMRKQGKEPMMYAGRKGNAAHPAYKAIDWALYHLARDTMPENLEVWHEGRCCRCGRKLTTPTSLETGIGPECAKKG